MTEYYEIVDFEKLTYIDVQSIKHMLAIPRAKPYLRREVWLWIKSRGYRRNTSKDRFFDDELDKIVERLNNIRGTVEVELITRGSPIATVELTL